MKLPDFLENTEFNRLRALMNAPLVDYSGAAGIAPITSEELHLMATEGIDVAVDAIVVGKDGTFSYRDRKVIIYIRDVSPVASGQIRLPKYHLAMCSTLEEAKEAKRLKSRYVVSTRRDGMFMVNIPEANSGKLRSSTQRLQVCKNCLDHIRWKGYHSQLASATKNAIFDEFDLTDYFSVIRPQLQQAPVQTDLDAPKNEYSRDWASISETLRKEVGYTCQNPGCKRNLSRYPGLVDVHHIDGNRSNNRRDNLIVLCVKCHSKQPMHQHMSSDKRMKVYDEVTQGS